MTWGIRLFRRDGYIRLIEDMLSEARLERDLLRRENAELLRDNDQLRAEVAAIDEAIAVMRTYHERRVAM